jgi:L-ribulose-5-phosphate 3-epimerase
MKFMKKIGIMQGRLSKPRNEKIQSFPVHDWEKEFELAAEIGYGSIEWVIDTDGIDKNPLFYENQRKTIHKHVEKYNVTIPAVCHDQLMELPLHSSDNNTSRFARTILTKTMEACESLGIPFIEIPLVGKGSLCNTSDAGKLADIFSDLESKAKQYGISFILETDLPPERNAALMEKMSGLSVGLNFDMGNSAYWGFDPDHELPLIGLWIKNVHVKDCTPQDYSLPLGEGDVDFRKVFAHLKNMKYEGLFILQAAPAEHGKEKDIAKKYYKFVHNKLRNYFHES